MFLVASLFLTILLMIRSIALKSDQTDQLNEDEFPLSSIRIHEDFLEVKSEYETMYRSWYAMRGCLSKGNYLLIKLTSVLAMAFNKTRINESIDVKEMQAYIGGRIRKSRSDDEFVDLPNFVLTEETRHRFLQSPLEFLHCRSLASRMLTNSARRSKKGIGFFWSLAFYVVPALGCLIYLFFSADFPRVDLIRELTGFAAFLFTLMLASRIINRIMNRISFGRELKNSVDVCVRVGHEGLIVETPYLRTLYQWTRILNVELLSNDHIAVVSRLPTLVLAVPPTVFENSIERQAWVQRLQMLAGVNSGFESTNSSYTIQESGNPYQPPRL